MPECGYSLTRNFPYKDRIYDSVLIRETIWVRENPYSGIFYPVSAFTAVETLDESLEKNYRLYVEPRQTSVVELKADHYFRKVTPS